MRVNPATMVAGVCALAFFVHLGGLPLVDLDEGAFSAATWEMLQRGDFVTTYLNGEPRFDKPILFYWFQAASVSALGLNEWALRLPSAIFASLWIWVVFRFVAEIRNPRTALLAAIAHATAVYVVIIGRAATADALLNLLITLTMLDAYRYIREQNPARLARVYLWMGLGVLTKGPVAVAIPFVVSLVYFIHERKWREWGRVILWWPGWVILLVIAGPWYLLEYLDQGQAFIDGFLLKHNVSRFTSTMESHGGSLFYYVWAVFLVLMPFGGWWLSTLRGVRSQWMDPLQRWLWLWFGFVFVFFSFSSTQLPHYLLYGISPLFILMSIHADELRNRWLAYALPLIFGLLLALLPEILDLLIARENTPYTREVMGRAAAQMGWDYRLATALFTAAAVGLLLARQVPPTYGLSALGVAQTVLMVGLVLPIYGEAQQQPVKQAAAVAREIAEPIVMWKLNMPSFTVYREAVTPQRPPLPGEVVFTRADRLDRVGPHEVLHSSGGVALARVAATPESRHE